MGYSFQIVATNLLYAPSHTQDSRPTTSFVTTVVEQCLERETAQWVHHEGSTRRHIEL